MSFQNPISGPDVQQLYLETFSQDNEKPIEKIVNQVNRGLSEILVTITDGRVSGFCIYQLKHRAEEVFIDYLAVDPKIRGGGLGALMINRVVNLARELGYAIKLLCGDHRISFYERFGFGILSRTYDDWNIMVL